MSTATLAPVATATATRKASDIAAKVEIGEPARALLRPDMTPRQFLDLLIQKDHLSDAVRFLAGALTKPEGVWWGIQGARATAVFPAALPPGQVAALAAAEKWLQDPSEDNRRAAFPAALEAGVSTPAGLVAIGVFYSGGSLAPASVPTVPAGEHLTAAMIAGAITQAAYSDASKAKERLKAFLTKGGEVATGLSRWPLKSLNR